MKFPFVYRRYSPHRPERGFALLITITLLAFLVLLLVSLATLTRVETQVASNTQQLSKARQNALMGLNIAIGQLQKFAGPDQRVTTTADIIATTNSRGDTAPTIEPYTATSHITISPSSRYWTAVWGNQETAINYTGRPNQIPPTDTLKVNYSRGITPTLLNWLVSGNEFSSLTLNGTQGGVTAGTAPVFLPSQAITPALTSATTPTDSLKFPDSTPGVLLVGPASTSDGTAAGKTASIAAGNYVVAPLRPINVPASVVPGLGSAATATPVGKYAYWIGDEGVKARLNIQPSYQATGQPDDQINSFIASQRSGIEFLNRDAPNTTLSTTTSATGINIFGSPALTADDSMNLDYGNAGVPLILSPRQLSLANTNGASASILETTAKVRFHDLTTYSYGVLSDTYAGGLKKDLTADIADPSTNGNNPAGDRPDDSTPIFIPRTPAEATTSPGLPRWTHLRNWVRANPSGGAIDTTSPASRSAGIYPIMANTSLGMDYFTELEWDNTQTPQPVKTLVLKMAFYPFFVLNNPYPVTIAAKDYDVIFRFDQNSKLIIEVDNNQDGNYKQIADIYLSKLAITPSPLVGTLLPDAFFRFHLRGEAIPPGQRNTYILKTDGQEYSPGLELVRGDGTTGTAMSVVRKCIITGPTITNDPTIFMTSRIRARATSMNTMMTTQTSVLMTEYDAFSNKTWADVISDAGRAKWYQSMIGTIPQIRCYTPTRLVAGSPGFFSTIGTAWGTVIDPITGVEKQQTVDVSSETANGISIGDLIKNRIPSVQATSAFRTSPVYQGNAWYSSDYHVGLPYGSRIRFIATGNLRAPFIQPSNYETVDPLPTGNARGIGDKVAAVITGAVIAGATAADSLTGQWNPHPGMSYNGMGYNKYSTGFGSEPSSGSTTPAILWDLLDSPDRLLSLGQLQHVPFARYGFQSSYLFGNSYADMRVQRNTTHTPIVEVVAPSGSSERLYDTSWLLNRALWDKYFVSGVPSTWTQGDIDQNNKLPNARMTLYRRGSTSSPSLNSIKYTGGTNTAYDQAAANLLVSGSFNINSTSEQAWRAVLSSTYRIPLNSAYANSGDGVETAIPYPRFSHNISASVTPGVGIYVSCPVTMDSSRLYLGNRGLYLGNPAMVANASPESVVNELARSIVNEIRQRGPFLSMADFVNRPLTTINDPVGIKGALQAGMDNMDPNVAQVNPAYLSQTFTGYPDPRGDRANGFPDRQYAWNTGSLLEHAVGGPVVDQPGTAWPNATTDPKSTFRSGGFMAPKFLTQADILSSLGPMLSPRSDTFTIRTYGESVNPATGESTGKAWCEAVVQRTPEFVDQTDAALATLRNSTPLTSVNSANANFGRKFKIISFRWLSPGEI